MPVRRAMGDLLSRAVERNVKKWIGEAAPKAAADAELHVRIEKLEKKVSMTMGAVQAATADLMKLKAELEEARRRADQAMQRAESALSTAEAAAEK